ncbi:hypothetical protein HG534_10060 [Moraxella osloensis]|nr:hypothetical protein [Moraxella osloensis]MBW4016638.1 hypothetical protein [Moraxella osloensis]
MDEQLGEFFVLNCFKKRLILHFPPLSVSDGKTKTSAFAYVVPCLTANIGDLDGIAT